MDPDETTCQQGTSAGDDTSVSSSQDESHERTIERLSSFTTTIPQSSAPHIHTENSESSSHDETKEPLPSFASLKPQQPTSRTDDTEDSDLSGRNEFRERVAEPFLGLILPDSNLSTHYVQPASSDFVSNVSTPKLESEPLPTFETLSTSAILEKIAYLSSITPITSESMSRVPLYVSQPSSSNVVDILSSDFHYVPRKRALELLSTRSLHIMTQPSTSNVTASNEFKSKKFCQLTPKSLPSLEVLTTLLSTSHVDTTSNESNKVSSEQSPAMTTHMFPTSTSNVSDTRNSDFSSHHKPNVRAAQSSTTMTFYMSQPSTFNVDTVISDSLNCNRVSALESYSSQTSTSNIDIGSSDSSVCPEYEVSESEPVTEITSYTSQPSMSKVITESSDSSVRPEPEVSESESEVTSYTSQPSTSKLFDIGSSDFSSRCESPNLASALFSRYSSGLSQPGTSHGGTHEFSQNLPVLTDEDLRELEILSMPVQGKERTFQCDSCPRKFYSQDTLTLHKYEHSAKRIFTCSICKAVYNNPVNYAKHFVIHIEQTKHLCHICGRMFYNEYLLVRHLRRHSDEGQ